jgi:adenylosuccinate synthase
MVGLGLVMLSCSAIAATPVPEIPATKGEQCVEPTADMRRNHMKYLLHQRDDTMHRGIRTKEHSLKECVECHVLPAEDGTYPRVTGKEHFCSACHSYAAVHIDCFECHSDLPEGVNPHLLGGAGHGQ